MSEMNLPPFFVGQRVVCIRSYTYQRSGVTIFTKGTEYIVNDVVRSSCKCNMWQIDVGVKAFVGGNWFCSDCKHIFPKQIGDSVFVDPQYFAPVEENFQSISLEKVMEKETPLISVN